MKLDFKKKMAFASLLAVFFVAFDRGLKILALNYYDGQSADLLNRLLYFSFAKNYRIAFSLPVGGIFLNILVGFIVLALIAILFIQLKKQSWPTSALLLILILGAASNLYDRLKYGFVIDYFDLKYFTVFNLADIMIVMSIILFLLKCKNYKKTARL